MNKKAELTMEEMIKIVLAVIGMGILIALLVQIYLMNTQSALEQARSTMQELENAINYVKENEKTDILIKAPKDWYILS